jgi:hypothetical protein
MDTCHPEEMRRIFKEQFGFFPPCTVGGAELGEDMEELIGEYHL